MGATYDSKLNLLTLKSKVNIETTGATPTSVNANSGQITKEPRQIALNSVSVKQTGRDIEADKVALNLLTDNSLDHVTASGNVRLRDTGPNSMQVRAPRADISMGQKNMVKSAVFSGGVQMEAAGENAMNGTAGKVTLDFGATNPLRRVVASDNVHIVQQPGNDKQTQTADISAGSDVIKIKNGPGAESAETEGPAQITLLSQEPQHAGEKTVITAGKFR